MIPRSFLVLVAFLLAVDAPAMPTVKELPAIPLSINGQKLVVEVARSEEEVMTGLMYRFSLKPDHGMLFVFDRPEPRAFWMKNTFIPLSIAFIAADGHIVNIEDMAPRDESTHWSTGPALYALEMRKGWFAERGIRAGDRVGGLPTAKPKG
jgi:uncharacterized protein